MTTRRLLLFEGKATGIIAEQIRQKKPPNLAELISTYKRLWLQWLASADDLLRK